MVTWKFSMAVSKLSVDSQWEIKWLYFGEITSRLKRYMLFRLIHPLLKHIFKINQ